MPIVDDYGFVLDGWQPACGYAAWVSWRKIEHLGLDYIEFRVIIAGKDVICRVDPCDSEATAPYTVMVRRDMDYEISKALKSVPAERKDIDGEGVRKLASYGCTREQIANYFGCSVSTIDHKFAADLRLGKATLQKNILMWQIRRGKVGSDNMLIHLGKVHCGQAAKGPGEEEMNQPPATDGDGNTLEP